MNLSDRLRIARNNAGVTQDAAAKTIGVTRTILVFIEQGKRRVKPEELIKLAKLYQVSCASLLREEPNFIDISQYFCPTKDATEEEQDDEQTAFLVLQKLLCSSLQLEHLLNRNLPPYHPFSLMDGKFKQQAELLAMQVRHSLGLGLSPISNIMTLIQNSLRTRLFIHPLPLKISGVFAYHPDFGSGLVVNAQHSKTQQAMSAARELANIYTRRYTVKVSWLESHEELFNNSFAMAFILPAAAMYGLFGDMGGVTAQNLIFMKNYFHVSMETILLRLEDLDILKGGNLEKLKESGICQVIDSEDNIHDCHSLRIPNYVLLAAEAYHKELLSEGQLADMFDLDRIEVRDKIEKLSQLLNEIDSVLCA